MLHDWTISEEAKSQGWSLFKGRICVLWNILHETVTGFEELISELPQKIIKSFDSQVIGLTNFPQWPWELKTLQLKKTCKWMQANQEHIFISLRHKHVHCSSFQRRWTLHTPRFLNAAHELPHSWCFLELLCVRSISMHCVFAQCVELSGPP